MRRCAISSFTCIGCCSRTRPMAKSETKVRTGGFGGQDSLSADYDSAWPVITRLLRECVFPNWRILVVSIAAMTFTAATAGALPFILQRVADEIFVAKD